MTIRDRIRRWLSSFGARLLTTMVGLRMRFVHWLAPEQVVALNESSKALFDAAKAVKECRLLLAAEMAERAAANARIEALTGGAPCSTCPIKAEAEQAREQRDMALRERDAAMEVLARLRTGQASDAQAYEDLRTASARDRRGLVDELELLWRRFDAAMEALDALYCAALGLHGLVATTPEHVAAYAALKAALKSARGPLGPWTKARGRRPVRVSEVRAGDRVCWAAAAGFVPLTVASVTPRDCHGMVTLTGEDRLLHLHADMMVTVERDPSNQPSRE